MNKIFLTGRITKDIELKGNENKFLSNTIAVYDGKDKNNQDITYFYDFKAFNYTATKLSSQAQKGSKIAIEGSLKQDKWEDESGKHSKIVVYVDQVEIIQEQPKQDKPQQEEKEDEADMPW